MVSWRGQAGQAAVELVALLPLALMLLAGAWQLVVAGHARWAAGGAAQAAARAAAIGADPRQAARAVLTAGLEHGLRVRTSGAGTVEVTLRVRLDGAQRAALAEAAERYGRYLGLPATVRTS
jgi:hypothetical protein